MSQNVPPRPGTCLDSLSPFPSSFSFMRQPSLNCLETNDILFPSNRKSLERVEINLKRKNAKLLANPYLEKLEKIQNQNQK